MSFDPPNPGILKQISVPVEMCVTTRGSPPGEADRQDPETNSGGAEGYPIREAMHDSFLQAGMRGGDANFRNHIPFVPAGDQQK